VRADFIARTTGTRSFPWRAIVIRISSGDKLNIQLSTGGGWAARIKKLIDP